jgi:hypothetical protein
MTSRIICNIDTPNIQGWTDPPDTEAGIARLADIVIAIVTNNRTRMRR